MMWDNKKETAINFRKKIKDMNFKVVKRKNALDLKSEKIKYSDDLTVKEYKDYLI
jgi:hypothetical protein